MGPRTRTVASARTSLGFLCRQPSSRSSTVADGSQTLGMNEGAGCRLKQSSRLFPLFSAASAFVRRPHPALSHCRPHWSRRLGFWCLGRFRAQLGLANADFRLGPTLDRALDFYRIPSLGRGIGVESREVGG